MEQWGDELDLGRSCRELILEDDLTFVEPALPGSSFLSRDSKSVKNPSYQIVSPELLTPTS